MPILPLRYKFALTQALVTPLALILSGGSLWLLGISLTGWGTFLFCLLATLYSLPLGVLAALPTLARIERLRQISAAWLRGNFNLRIAEPGEDDLGQLSGQLDLLAHQLSQEEDDLSEERERNSRLADQVRELTVVEERNRLARDLHDGVKQYLFSLGMTASAVRERVAGMAKRPDVLPADLPEMVEEIESSAKAAQREMSRLIEDLRPVSLQESGLAGALDRYALLFGAREHLLIYFQPQGTDQHLPIAVADALYRVGQEALLNVARHAMATRVDIGLVCLPEQVILTIKDNGAGFDTSYPSKGLGLGSMQERIMTVGGRVSIASQPGEGTTVTAEVALSRPGAALQEMGEEKLLLGSPNIESWGWLGQRLVIPVGQVWPWLPADLVHLRQPLVEPAIDPYSLVQMRSLLGLRQKYVLTNGLNVLPAMSAGRGTYAWQTGGAGWRFENTSGSRVGQMVLSRNGQPLAAMQYQGRMLNTWSEIVYDGHTYRLARDEQGFCALTDESGEKLFKALDAPPLQIRIYRTLPLNLLIMAAVRLLDEE